jgi:serine/threonine-protein kinase
MAEDLDAIAEELALPKFRVPAPQNSAQHAAATAVHSRPARNPTRQLIRDPQDWQPADEEFENPELASQFAGIDIGEFIWERQRARRTLMFWTLIVVLLTGAVAAAGWTLGSNLAGLIG